jgi:hypothetical protein
MPGWAVGSYIGAPSCTPCSASHLRNVKAGLEPATLRLTAEMIENLSALSGVAYEKLGAIFPSLVAPTPAPTAAADEKALSRKERMEVRRPLGSAHTETPATTFFSWAYFTVLWIPWGWGTGIASQNRALPELGARLEHRHAGGLCRRVPDAALFHAVGKINDQTDDQPDDQSYPGDGF